MCAKKKTDRPEKFNSIYLPAKNIFGKFNSFQFS